MKVDDNGKLLRVEEADLDKNGCFVCGTSITSIGANAFLPVKYLIKGAVLRKVQTISQFAFLDCEELEYVHFSKNLKAIDYGAFMGCCRLKEVVFPKELSTLGFWAFLDCASIKKVEFLGDLKKVDDLTKYQACDFFENKVFERCRQIEIFVFHNNIVFNKGFKNYEKLKEIEIADEKVAMNFWREAIYDCPQSFMFLDTKLFYNSDFVKQCFIIMELSFEKQFGTNGILARHLAEDVFEQKLLLEEQKCFDVNKEIKKEEF